MSPKGSMESVCLNKGRMNWMKNKHYLNCQIMYFGDVWSMLYITKTLKNHLQNVILLQPKQPLYHFDISDVWICRYKILSSFKNIHRDRLSQWMSITEVHHCLSQWRTSEIRTGEISRCASIWTGSDCTLWAGKPTYIFWLSMHFFVSQM